MKITYYTTQIARKKLKILFLAYAWINKMCVLPRANLNINKRLVQRARQYHIIKLSYLCSKPFVGIHLIRQWKPRKHRTNLFFFLFRLVTSSCSICDSWFIRFVPYRISFMASRLLFTHLFMYIFVTNFLALLWINSRTFLIYQTINFVFPFMSIFATQHWTFMIVWFDGLVGRFQNEK